MQELGSALQETLRLLGSVSGSSVQAPPVRGVGSAADDMVRAEVSEFGRLEELTLDPKLMRQGTTAIAEYVVTAVRAAQDDAHRQTQELLAAAPDTVAPAELTAFRIPGIYG